MEIPQEDRKPVPYVEEITPRIDEKGLLQPECGHHIIRIYPQGLTREERSAYKTISRVNEQLEQPLLRRKAKPSRPKRKRRSRRRPVSAPSTQDPRLAAHQARCSICCHEDREDIEEEFIRWHSPRNMAEDYSVDARAIYRHAHALNLFALRDRNIRHALGRIIDRADRIPVMTPAAVIRAVHAFVRINSDGQWVEPPSHLIVSSGSRPAAAPSSEPSVPPQLEAAGPSPSCSNELAQDAPPPDPPPPPPSGNFPITFARDRGHFIWRP